MRARAVRLCVLATLFALALPAVASAEYGQGPITSTDQHSTYAGFIIIAFFPVLALVLTLVQSALERRKDRRVAAQRARAASARWRGGW